MTKIALRATKLWRNEWVHFFRCSSRKTPIRRSVQDREN